ncbi:uncharacterized protein ATC70_011849 [Mucor velutinosus]|uniref:Ubiquitin carboxyl-terminal hydrolase n=1 Tax=Mucor velutinosus TaxID=708070 RepID=A0AAN7DEI1_9FUNG|nr:hypothetical protein ATC70_011849 [Mucor velutinosus]
MNGHVANWALIPSDPAVFNDMIQQYGVDDARAVDIFGLDLLDEMKDNTVHGLIYIFPYEEEALPDNFEQQDPLASNIIFTSQLVTNSCATLALLAVLFNADINKGDILNNFLQFTQGFSATNRGWCLSYENEIRSIHNAYASNAYHTAEAAMDATTEYGDANYEVVETENYHYISYIYNNGFVWELDGLKSQPVRLQECTHEEWITAVKPIIQQRMQDRMDVSLLAITKDGYRTKLKQKNAYSSYLQLSNQVTIKRLAKSTVSRRKKAFFDMINEADTQYHDTMKDIWSSLLGQDFASAQAKLDTFAMDIEPFNREVDQLTVKREQEKANSIRQKFDYFPFIRALFKSSFQYNVLHDTTKPVKQKSAKEKTTKIPAKKTSSMKPRPAKKAARKKS